MKFLKHSWLILLFTVGFGHGIKAQCSIFPFFSANYDCVTNTGTTSYIINGAQTPYTCTIVAAGNVTVGTASGMGNTGTVTPLPVGSYTVYITSANNCTTTSAYTVVNPFSPASIAFTNTNVTCFGGNNGSSQAIASASTFSAPLSYTWTTGSNAPLASGLMAGVLYSVTIKDSKGCTVTNSVILTEPAQINSTVSNTHIPCFGTAISVNVNSTGGTPPFTYTVDGIPCVGNVANNLFVGVHTILTKDSKGCLRTNTVSLSQAIQPVITFSITKPSCHGKTDGSASATITSAPAPFTYSWTPGFSTIPSLSGIPVGNYTLTVKDGSACVTKSVAVVSPVASMSLTANTTPENCSAVDGAATLNVAGGNFPYNFNTQPGPLFGSNLNLLSSGSYTSVVTDANNCIDTLVFNVGNLSTVSVSIVSFTPALCYNQCTGAISLSVQNAIQPVTYSVTNTPTTTSNIFSNLCAGFYNIKAIDANGCPAFTNINFPTPPVFSYSATAPPAICFGKPVSLQASAFGGAGGFTYMWNPGNITGQSVNLVPAGTTVYSLNVYDANGCTLAPFQLTVEVSPPIAININTVNVGICPGTTAQITPTITGGDGNYVYTWLPGQINTESIFVENAAVPVYTLTVNDGCGSPTAIKIIPINLFPVITPLFTVSDTVGCEPLCTSFTNITPKSTNAIWNYGDKPFEQPGNTTNYCYVKNGYYNIKLTVNDSNHCKTAYTYSNVVRVLAGPKADFKTNPAIITLNNAENVLIENLTANGGAYDWRVNGIFMGNSHDINYTFKDTGCYFIRLIAKNHNNCIDTSEKFVCVIEGFNFYMPNCISVNSDNVNDVLIPKGTGWTSKNYLFEVYNRWGNRIFKTQDPKQGWDGKWNGDSIDQMGVYYWRVNITDNIEDIHEMRGHVTILR